MQIVPPVYANGQIYQPPLAPVPGPVSPAPFGHGPIHPGLRPPEPPPDPGPGPYPWPGNGHAVPNPWGSGPPGGQPHPPGSLAGLLYGRADYRVPQPAGRLAQYAALINLLKALQR